MDRGLPDPGTVRERDVILLSFQPKGQCFITVAINFKLQWQNCNKSGCPGPPLQTGALRYSAR